jgi:hypothetical protein
MAGHFFSARTGRRGRMGRMGEKRKRGSPFFSYALLPPIRPILPLLPVLALKKCPAMLRCQIKRQKKTEPYSRNKKWNPIFSLQLITNILDEFFRLLKDLTRNKWQRMHAIHINILGVIQVGLLEENSNQWNKISVYAIIPIPFLLSWIKKGYWWILTNPCSVVHETECPMSFHNKFPSINSNAKIKEIIMKIRVGLLP